jgi:hypothetical protein
MPCRGGFFRCASGKVVFLVFRQREAASNALGNEAGDDVLLLPPLGEGRDGGRSAQGLP